MFRSAKMCKARLIGMKTNLYKTVDALERFGGAEIKRIHPKGTEISKQSDEHDEIVAKQLRLEALLLKLVNTNGRIRILEKDAVEFLCSKDFREADEKITKIAMETESIDLETANLKDLKIRLKMFANTNIDFGKLKANSIEIIAGIAQSPKKEKVSEALRKIEENISFIEKSASKNSNLFIIAIKKGNEQILENAVKAGFERITLPEIDSNAQNASTKSDKKIAELALKKEKLEKELGKISAQFYLKLAAAHEMLKIQAAKSGAATSFASTEHSFIMEAYLPEKNYAEFESAMEKEFSNKFQITKISSEDLSRTHEEAPTLLEHSKILAPFEFMTKFVSIPKSNEIDPTVIFLIFFPIFYGMMVGDVIYGIISFLIARAIMSKVTSENILKPISQIWMWSAIPTIIFGIIFDEYLGASHTELAHLFFGIEHFQIYHGLERIHNTELLLGITILVGIATVAIGFVLGAINAISHGNKKHAIAKTGWLGFTLFGSAAVATFKFSLFPTDLLIPFAVMLAGSLIAILWAEGLMGVIEIPSVMGNILSFARIIAVGLVGTIIAVILNEMAFPSPDKGILLILFIPLYIIGHILNAGLAMFESLIQGARLNYVEFYSKFYEGGGKEFSPFRFERKYTKVDT